MLRPNGYLQDENNIIKDFKDRLGSGKPCNPYAVEQDDPGLYGAISLNYKSYDHFLKKLGLDPDEIRKYKKWSLDRIRSKLNEIYYNDGYFNSRTHKKLALAIISRYDSLDGGLERLKFIRNKDNYLRKLCPSCGREIINRYDSRSEFCESCRGKNIKISAVV
jgi:predicted RNA-binding Zn-ribbon protein involved in translation (DUF1610 family)